MASDLPFLITDYKPNKSVHGITQSLISTVTPIKTYQFDYTF